eukprot:gene13118-7582_t
MAIFHATYEMPKPRMWTKHISMFDVRKRFRESGGGAGDVPTVAAAVLAAVAAGQSGARRRRPRTLPVGSGAPVERDARVLSEDDLNRYVEGLERNGGFRAPNYYSKTIRAHWGRRGVRP